MTTTEEILDWHSARTRTANAFEGRFREWIAKNEQRAFNVATSADGTLEMSMLDVIGEDWWTGGGITASKVKAQLDANKGAKTIKVLMNSPGGDAFEGLAIHSLLRHSGARVEIEIMGLAASAATVVAMAADTLTVHEGAMFMVHQAWSILAGSSTDMLAMAEFLTKVDSSATDVYASRTGRPREEIAALLAAETWMTAQESVDAKFVDSVVPARAAPAALAKASASPRPAAGAMLQAHGLPPITLSPSSRWMGSGPSVSASADEKKVRRPQNGGEKLLLANFRRFATKALGKPWPSARAQQRDLLNTFLSGASIVDAEAKEHAERCRAQLVELGISLVPLDS